MENSHVFFPLFLFFKYATWYRDEAGLHTAADLVSVVFERSANTEGFAGHEHGDEDIDPLTTSCSAMQGVLSVSPKLFTEDSKMASLGGKLFRSVAPQFPSTHTHLLLWRERNVEGLPCRGRKAVRLGRGSAYAAWGGAVSCSSLSS